MKRKLYRRVLALLTAVLLLAGCTPQNDPTTPNDRGGALTWGSWSGFDSFLELARQTYPDIELEISVYDGANRTGYSWARMRADDIPDVFITNSILDEELCKERLMDLSGYDFINDLSTALLDQVAVDGGIYLLPANNTMYGIYYNKTLMEERGWEVPTNFAELEALCGEIRDAGLIPGILSTQLTGHSFSAVFNLAKTDWFTTPEGMTWERDFLAGNATAVGAWEGTMDYVQKYRDIGMFTTDPDDRDNTQLLEDYLNTRRAVFYTGAWAPSSTHLGNGDELGMMPYIGEDGSKNIYMYSSQNYIGLSRRLAQPGNEKKLAQALDILSLLFSHEGQDIFITETTPCVLSVLDDAEVAESSLLYDAQQAMAQGRAFPMTYAHWDAILSDIGQGFKEWFRGENGMTAAKAIARMDELQSSYLNTREAIYFCESTADFTMEETAALIGKALGSSVGADAAIIPYATVHREGVRLKPLVTGKLYQDQINIEVSNAIAPGVDGEYAILTMTGAQAKELAAAGFDLAEDGDAFPYVLVVKGGGELEDGKTYRVAFLMETYTQEVGETYHAQVEKAAFRTMLRAYLAEQKTVSPDGNPWN